MRSVALLRAVNVAGHQPVSSSALIAVARSLGFSDPVTVLASGNLVFTSATTSPEHLERRLEQKVSEVLGFDTPILVRTAVQWAKVLEDNPFPAQAESDPGHLLVMPLKQSPRPSAWDDLRHAIQGREAVNGRGAQAYLYYPDGVGRSKLTITVIERILKTRGTARNWNTAQKFRALLGGR